MDAQQRNNIDTFRRELKAIREVIHEHCDSEMAAQVKLKLGKACRIIVNLIDEIDMAKDHEIELAKQSLFRVGKEINEDTRIVKKAKDISVAHILNELSDLQNDNSL